MSKQVKMKKKGVSVIIGYILLVAFAIVLAVIVYNLLKTYQAKAPIECPEGVSLLISSVSCNENNGIYSVELGLKNNGRFNIDGYFVKVSQDSDLQIDTTDISNYIDVGGIPINGYVAFEGGDPLEISETVVNIFEWNTVSAPLGEIYSITLMPIRYTVIENKVQMASCTLAQVREEIICEHGSPV